MATRHVIVDGSNLATEGRNMPSLEQLDQAVREFMGENPTDEVTVVVDASFGHRIDPSEVPAFEAAEEAGEVVSPPAGAIGRGDAFLLRIAEKIGATVLSNDSFQEFHGEHTWLFEKGRLIGGKPVPGVGWIFMDRTPVRGAKSREVVKEAKRRKRAETVEAPDGAGAARSAEKPAKARPKAVDRAIARATQEVVEPKADGGGKSRRRRTTTPPAEPVNEPLAFITFIAAHPLESEVVGAVVEYSSHGAFVEADGARCYIPLSAMGDPPPRKAREVVTKGDSVTFVVQAFDPQRRGIELALPGFAHPAGGPTAETVEAEISGEARPSAPKGRRRLRSQVEAAGAPGAEADHGELPEAAAEEAPPRPRRGRRPASALATAGTAEAEPTNGAEPELGAEPAPAPRRRRVARPAPAVAEAEQDDTGMAAPGGAETTPPARKRASARKSPAVAVEASGEDGSAEAVPQEAAPQETGPQEAAGRSGAAPVRPRARKTAAKKAALSDAPVKEAAVKETAARKAPARKATARKAALAEGEAPQPPEEAPAARKAPARKATARKTSASKAAAPEAVAGGQTAPDAPAPAAAPVRKAAARKVAAKKAPAKKATAAAESAPAAVSDPGGSTEGVPAKKRAPARKAAKKVAPPAEPTPATEDANGRGAGPDQAREPGSSGPRRNPGRRRTATT